jgi:hypothetical protein
VIHCPLVMLRGSRNYVHSTDLYPELLRGAELLGLGRVDGPIDLKLRHLIATQPEFHYGVAPAPEAPATFLIRVAATDIEGWIGASDRPVTDRCAYDEAKIWERAVLEDRTIRMTDDPGMKPIEVVTALSVLQHRKLLPPATGRRWLLARLQLARPLRADVATECQIRLTQTAGRSMTRSVIATPTEVLGTMTFILG